MFHIETISSYQFTLTKKNLETFIIILNKNDMENVSNNDLEDDHYKDETKYRASATKKEQP